jgi:hypothetical protein
MEPDDHYDYLENDIETAQAQMPDPETMGFNRQVLTQYDNESIQYLSKIISDDTLEEYDKWLTSAKLKKKTKKNLNILVINAFSIEYVLNNYPGYSWYRKNYLHFRAALLQFSYSRLESKYNDIQYILKVIENHHMNKLMRSMAGFERETQHTSFLKGSQESYTGKKEELKSGVSRFVSRRGD